MPVTAVQGDVSQVGKLAGTQRVQAWSWHDAVATGQPAPKPTRSLLGVRGVKRAAGYDLQLAAAQQQVLARGASNLT
jgi:hypothetical protein